jgi:hypothetical protein
MATPSRAARRPAAIPHRFWPIGVRGRVHRLRTKAGLCLLFVAAVAAHGAFAADLQLTPRNPICPSFLIQSGDASLFTTSRGTEESLLLDELLKLVTRVRLEPLPDVFVLTPKRIEDRRQVLKLLNRIMERRMITRFEASTLWFPRTTDPHDPLFSSQRITLDAVNAPHAWDRISKIPAAPVLVGLVDTGVAYDHFDLTNEMWPQKTHGMNFAGPSPTDETHDFDGHGTSVAGVLAATSNNEHGIASIAWQGHIQIVIAKFTENAAGNCTQNLIKAIDYAANLGATVLNLSAGGNQESMFLKLELEKLEHQNRNLLIVAAVANKRMNIDGPPTPYPDYPTSYGLPNVIAVQSADCCGGFSPSAYGAHSVHIAAPGVDVETTDHGGNDSYTFGTGTSMAAPQVSAAAALISAYAPLWTYGQIRQYLIDSARNAACDLPGAPAGEFSLCGKSQSGGVLNVDAATGAPVVIDAPFGGERWTAKSTRVVTWHPLFTTNLCPDVDLLLLTDNDRTWTSLASNPSTPKTRDMSAMITLPESVPRAKAARIVVRCHDTNYLERWSNFFEIK